MPSGFAAPLNLSIQLMVAIDHCVLIHLGAQWHSRYLWDYSAARNEVNHRLVVQSRCTFAKVCYKI